MQETTSSLQGIDVFLSYGRHERAWAEKLANTLRAHQFNPWMEKAEPAPGEDWRRAIQQAVTSAPAIVILIGTTHSPSPFQELEWRTALESAWQDHNKKLIPLVFGDALLPSFLAKWQALRVNDPKKDWDSAMDELLHVLRDDGHPSERTVSGPNDVHWKRLERLKYIEEAARALKTGG
jgi:hypothetical protein